jgi:DNA-binding transcriptional LysR family regulator
MNATQADPTLLIALVAVAEELSFSRASVRLGVTKGTISRKIARLESLAGVPLVWRSTHAVSLTDHGRDLYERARGPVRALDRVAYQTPRADAPLTGSVRLAAPHDVASTLLPPVLEAFLRAHPSVSFEVSVGTETVNLVRAGIDLALRVAVHQLPRSSLVARKLCDVHLGCFASPSYLERRGQPRTFGEPAHTWLSFLPRAHGAVRIRRREQTILGAPEGFRPHRSDDFSLLRELARRGVGVAGLPVLFAEPLVRSGELCAVLSRVRPALVGALHLVSAPRRNVPPQVAAFRAHLVRHLAPSG